MEGSPPGSWVWRACNQPRNRKATPVASSERCAQCDSQLEANSAVGLCPECLEALGLQIDQSGQITRIRTALADRKSASNPFAPTREQLAQQFPEFAILETIGQGEMATVYKAQDRRLEDRVVALKILSPALAGDQARVSEFIFEGRVLANLRHPNVVTLHDIGWRPSDLHYFVMEFVDGTSVRELSACTGGKWNKVVSQVCNVLRFVRSRGFILRKLTPQSVLVDRRFCVKLAASAVRGCVFRRHTS